MYPLASNKNSRLTTLPHAGDRSMTTGNGAIIVDNRSQSMVPAGMTSLEKNKPLQLKPGSDVIQLGTGPYGRDVNSLSFENILIFLYDLLDFISFGFLEDLTRLINLHRAHDAEHAVAAIAARRIEAWIRFIFRVLIRSGLMYLLIGLFPPGVIGFYLSLLISNVLNWLNERLIVILGEYAHHEGQGTTGSALALGYLRWVEGVEPESADYTVVRRSGRRTGDTGRAMGSAEQMPGGRLSAQDAAGGLWNFLSRHFRYEWGHRQADSQRGTNTSSNLGSESMGANSQEMVSEAYASDLSRANPGNVRRRNFALRFAGALFDRIRRITTVVNGNPLITESVRADRGPMTSLERTTLESDYANERSYVVGLNLRNSALVPIVVAILLALVHFIFF